jgi:hypothetical protein
MSTIFRAPLITAIAALSTTAANTAQPQQNRNVLLPIGSAPFIAPDFELAPRVPVLGIWHHRPAPPPGAMSFNCCDWPNPAMPLRQIVIDPVRNRILLPLPPPGVPFICQDFPLPQRPTLKPETHLFYYMQDQTSPAFIQYDWPKAPKLPTVDTPPVRNQILFPVFATPVPFRQTHWLNPVIVQLAKVNDPPARNTFLPPPVGLPTSQTDWPRPHGAKSQQGSHTLNDLGLLTLPIARPVRPIDWPNPRLLPYAASARVDRTSVSILLQPRFKPEWATDSNQMIGPWEPQPETH